MKNDREKNIKKYLDKVSKNVICSKSEKIFYLKEIEQLLQSFMQENSDLTYEDLEKNFGSPEIFARQLSEKEDYSCLLKKAKRRALILKILGIVCAVACAFAICLAVYLIAKYGGRDTLIG